jgi:hypothetical protein
MKYYWIDPLMSLLSGAINLFIKCEHLQSQEQEKRKVVLYSIFKVPDHLLLASYSRCKHLKQFFIPGLLPRASFFNSGACF